ncbi:MAG: 3-deoxy-D-manno-octulosonic acid kinase [Deltaproteobacteria bacterium]|nr:3-deoxy-D-manno-octulosonic acid kinase [Deltaproteobacteria bacterium]
MKLSKVKIGNFLMYFASDSVDPSLFLDKFLRTGNQADKGRGGLKLLSIDGKLFACRKYLHGGVGRALTKDLFLTEKRALNEIEIMFYLKENNFPVVEPVGILVGEDYPFKKPHIITMFEDNIGELLEFIKVSIRKKRLRAIRDLARFIWRLESLGIYHPDLHLRNVLVKEDGKLTFLDFDKAYRKVISRKDIESMVWRLNRFAEKWELKGYFRISMLERLLFLRTYSRLSGYDLEIEMAKKIQGKRFLSQIGWFFESILYGSKKLSG